MSIENLLNKSEYRKWIICKELYLTKKKNISVLMKLCNCTAKTIRKDIEEINNKFFKVIEMPFIKDNKGYIYIEPNQEVPINAIYKIVIFDSFQLKLLNEIIKNRDINITNFSRQYFRSTNYIYKMIIVLNAYLKLFELKIVKYKIIGEEYKICIFLFNFYWSMFDGINWPFDSISKKLCKEEVQELEKSFSNEFSWIEHEKLCFLIAVIFMREKSVDNYIKIENLKYWKCLDTEGQNLITLSVEKLKLKMIKNKKLLMLIVLTLISDTAKLKGEQLTLKNFSDSYSKASQSLILRLIKNCPKIKKNEIVEAQNEIMKIVHYSRLGEAYTLLALNPVEETSNLVDLRMYPELACFTKNQALQIIRTLSVQNIIRDTEYIISVSTKYGEMDRKNIVKILEESSPNNFVYTANCNNNINHDLILTDFNLFPNKKNSLQLQFMHPFNKNRAIEIVNKIKKNLKL